jgi:hypothetical protein
LSFFSKIGKKILKKIEINRILEKKGRDNIIKEMMILLDDEYEWSR